VFFGSPHTSFVVSAVSFHFDRMFCELKSTDNTIDEDFDLAYDLAGLENEIVALENDVFDPASNIVLSTALDDILGCYDVDDLGGINAVALADDIADLADDVVDLADDVGDLVDDVVDLADDVVDLADDVVDLADDVVDLADDVVHLADNVVHLAADDVIEIEDDVVDLADDVVNVADDVVDLADDVVDLGNGGIDDSWICQVFPLLYQLHSRVELVEKRNPIWQIRLKKLKIVNNMRF
jgi:hypothetical protein